MCAESINTTPCIEIKRFLFWTYRVVNHSYKIFSIRKFMWWSKDFTVEYKCEKCGLFKERSFVNADELLLEGITVENIQEIGTSYFYL
jgi:hypothetical protein